MKMACRLRTSDSWHSPNCSNAEHHFETRYTGLFNKFRHRLVRRIFRRGRQSLTAPPTKSRTSVLRKRFRRVFDRLFRFDSPRWVVDASYTGQVNKQTLGWREYANPIRWCQWSFSFFISWMLSRQFTKLTGAVPALLAGLAICGLVLTASNPSTRLSSYREMFDEFLNSKDYPAALVTIGALVDHSPDSQELRFHQAAVLGISGQMDEAASAMEKLVEQHQHPHAALWLISQQCNLAEIKTWTSDDHQRFRNYINSALMGTEGEHLLSTKILMSSYLAAIGANAEAIRYYEEIVPQKPELALSAAGLCKSNFDETAMLRFAKVAEKFYSSQLSQSPNNTNFRLGLAQAMMLTDRTEDASKLLNDGYRLTSDQRLARMLGSVLAVWENRLVREDDGPRNLLKRLQIVHAAIKVSPNDPTIGQAAIQVLIQCRDTQDPAVAQLRKAILSGEALASSHFIRGTMALLQNRFDEALEHLRIASDDSNLPGILNNFAVAISETRGGNLEHALKLSQVALEKSPTHPYFLETRGQILLKMERWQEAISDLELALNAPELSPVILPSLERAYAGFAAARPANSTQRNPRSLTN